MFRCNCPGSIANAFALGGNVLFDLRGSDTLGTNLNDMTLTGPISGSGRILAVGDAAGKTLTLSGAKPLFSGGLIQSGQSNNYNTPGGSAVTTRFMNIAIDDVLSLGTGQFYARIDTGVAATAGFGTLKTNADLSAGSGVTNPIDIGQSARLVVEATGANHLKLSGAITGAGNLFKIGTATLTLSGLNSYTGNTTISEGTLSVGADANLGASPSVVFNGGTLQVTGTALTSLGIHTPSFVATKVARFEIVSAANTFTVSQSVASTSGGLIKTGAGTLSLTASNSGSYTGVTNVAAGVLLLNNANAVPGGIATLGGTSRIEFNGGVIGLGVGDFTRNLGNTTTDATFVGAGGWAAYTADRTVNLGGAGVTIDWSAIDGSGFNSQTLILGAATADKTVTLVNPLTLGAALQTLQVDNGSAADDAILSGGIASLGFGEGVTKTGDGAVQLNGTQFYDVLNATAGTTNVNGALGTAPGLAAVTASPGAKVKFGTVSQHLASLTIGAGGTVTFTSGTAAGAFTGGGGGGGKAPGFGAAVVPEPGTFGLLLVGALGMLSRRRRQA